MLSFPPQSLLNSSSALKKRRVCHRGACYRILCVLFVTQESFSRSVKWEPVLLCVVLDMSTLACVHLLMCGCLYVCLGLHLCGCMHLWILYVPICVCCIVYVWMACECMCTTVWICAFCSSTCTFTLCVCVSAVEPWELGSVSADCSNSEGELLCFSALCWIPFQPDTIPQSHSSELSAAVFTAPVLTPLCSHTHPDHCFSAPGSGHCQRLPCTHRNTVLWWKGALDTVCLFFLKQHHIEISWLSDPISQWHYPCPQWLINVIKYNEVRIEYFICGSWWWNAI